MYTKEVEPKHAIFIVSSSGLAIDPAYPNMGHCQMELCSAFVVAKV